MPIIDFDEAESESGEKKLVPPGTYRVRVCQVSPGTTSTRKDRWGVMFAITEGPHREQTVWDNWYFTPRARPRVCMACRALGLNPSGKVDLQPDMLKGRECLLTVVVNQVDGKDVNEVPFAGYAPLEEPDVAF